MRREGEERRRKEGARWGLREGGGGDFPCEYILFLFIYERTSHSPSPPPKKKVLWSQLVQVSVSASIVYFAFAY
jgi:hypothetical protein